MPREVKVPAVVPGRLSEVGVDPRPPEYRAGLHSV